MRFNRIFGTLALISLAAWGQSTLASTTTDRMRDLERRYDESSAVSRDSLTGWHTGRCYSPTQRNSPQGALLALETSMEENEDGPLFPPREVLKIVVVVERLGNPSHFDEITYSEEREIQNYIDQNISRVREAEPDESGTWVGGYRSTVDWSLRQSEDYLLVKISDQDGRTDGMCYFFDRVRN